MDANHTTLRRISVAEGHLELLITFRLHVNLKKTILG